MCGGTGWVVNTAVTSVIITVPWWHWPRSSPRYVLQGDIVIGSGFVIVVKTPYVIGEIQRLHL